MGNENSAEFNKSRRERILGRDLSDEMQAQFDVPFDKWRANETHDQLVYRRYKIYKCMKKKKPFRWFRGNDSDDDKAFASMPNYVDSDDDTPQTPNDNDNDNENGDANNQPTNDGNDQSNDQSNDLTKKQAQDTDAVAKHDETTVSSTNDATQDAETTTETTAETTNNENDETAESNNNDATEDDKDENDNVDRYQGIGPQNMNGGNKQGKSYFDDSDDEDDEEMKTDLAELKRTRTRKWLTLKEGTTESTIQRYTRLFTIDAFFAEQQKRNKKYYDVNMKVNNVISLVQADIVRLEVDCIVNAANESLLGGGGIDHAIHNSAGKLLQRECALHGEDCGVGECVITKGYNLPAKYVIHTVGPCVMMSGDLDPVGLAKSYTGSLELAIKHGLRSIAFCCISTGVYGYPLKDATITALKTVRTFLEKDDNYKHFDRVIFDTFMDKEYNMYKNAIPVFFPMPEDFKYDANLYEAESDVEYEDEIKEEDKDKEEEAKSKDSVEQETANDNEAADSSSA